MTRTIFVVCMLITGCATMVVPASAIADRVDATCSAGPFIEYGNCFESWLDAKASNWRIDPTASRWIVFIQWAKNAGALVAKSAATETDARAAAIRFRRDVQSNLDLYPPELGAAPSEGDTSLRCTSVNLGGGVSSTNCQ